MKYILVLLALMFTFTAAFGQNPLLKHRWNKRVLVIFSPQDQTSQSQEQASICTPGSPEWEARKLAVYEVSGEGGLTPDGNYISLEDARRLRKGYGISLGEFMVVLVGLDGKEKLRSSSPVSLSEIYALIDSMPMRKEEQEGQKSHDP